MSAYVRSGYPDYDIGTLKGTVYTSLGGNSTLQRLGFDPDSATEVLVDYVAEAIDDIGYGYDIYGVRDDYPDLDNENVTCDSSCETGALSYFRDYINGNPQRVEKDFNICITGTSYDGGDDCGATGCAEVGGCQSTAATEGAYEIAQLYGDSWQRYHAKSENTEALQTGLMEVGHNLGQNHSDGRRYEKNSSTCAETPQYTGFTGTNSCGDSIADCYDMDVELDMYWSRCARNAISKC
jgi:hypothetical protein